MNLREKLIAWYRVNKRDLPWRETRDPYLIWISEIIFQQTRISQGLEYYRRFIGRFPDIGTLSVADEQDVLRMWQGLGYYSRARNLHYTAKKIYNDMGGVFPGSFADLRKLKGVGDYTAAAIASISFGEPVPVVDGNVIRFLSRLEGITEPAGKTATIKMIREIATQHIDADCPGDFNQAMMEFGALVCTPASPGCDDCIFRDDCKASIGGLTGQIPARSPKKKIRQRRIRYFVITFLSDGRECILLNHRRRGDIWENLFDFPSVEIPLFDTAGKTTGNNTERKFPLGFSEEDLGTAGQEREYVHLLTHQRLLLTFRRFSLARMPAHHFMVVPIEKIREYPVPRIVERYLEEECLI